MKIILRRTRTLLWTAFSILVILAAVGVGVGKLLMPFSERYQPQLEAWLSEEFGQPVVIDSFSGEWTAFGPRLTLRGLRLLGPGGEAGDPDREPEVVIESAALDIKPQNLLLPGFRLYNFRVIGADFQLLRTPEGELSLSGFGVSNRGGGQESALGELARVGEVVLQDSSLQYIDEKIGMRLGFGSVRGRLQLDGNELSAEVRANLSDQRSGLDHGEVEATLKLVLDEERRIVSAAWQATSNRLMMAALQGKLPSNPFLPLTGWLDAEAWGDWSRAEGHHIRGVTDLRDALLVNDYQDLHLERVNARFNWNFRDRGDWNLHLADFLYDDGLNAWITPRLSLARNTSRGLGLWVSADKIPLGAPLGLVRDVMSIYDTDWPRFLPRRAQGDVSQLDIVLDTSWRLRWAEGQVREGSVSDWQGWPDVSGVSGNVSLRDGYGDVHLRGERISVNWPRMFLQPLSLAVRNCRVDLDWSGGWQAGFEGCSLENADLALKGDIWLSGNGGRPGIDANFALMRARIGHLDPYWPEKVISENTRAWLRRGLIDGELVRGRFQMHGDLDDFPFRDGKGRFEITAELAGGHVDYVEGWPQAREVDVVARFVGAGMDIRGSVGDLAGITASPVRVTIEDMKTPVLEVSYAADCELPQLLAYLQQSPLQQQVRVDLAPFEFTGAASTEGRVTVPLGISPGELSVESIVRLDEARFADPAHDVVIDGLSGVLHFDEAGFHADTLAAEYDGRPALLDLRASADDKEKFRADLRGVFPVQSILPPYLLEKFYPINSITGDSEWQASLVVGPGGADSDNDVILTLESELRGVTIDLPEPLSKPPDTVLPVSVMLPLADPPRPLDVVFDDVLALRFDLTGEGGAPRRAVIRLDGRLAPLPPEGMLRIEGEAGVLDLDGWIDLVTGEISRGTAIGGLDFEQGWLSAGELRFMDRRFDDVTLQFNADGQEFSAGFESENIDGFVRYTRSGSAVDSLTAEFDRLVLGEPVSDGVSMETDPADLPALHLYARSFNYGGIDLGETRIEAYPTATGLRFDKVDAASDRISVQASGDWSLAEDGQRSEFRIHMASESLGDFLSSMEISSAMQGGQTLVNFNAWWPGSPAEFALSRLNGELSFNVVDGNITNAGTGTGRLLGLLSVQALPKRLSLDFRDVFDTGFSFDEATGTFEMQNGIARTDDVLLESSAATISVSGQTDLVQQRYDQLLTIRPGVGNTLPIIGALAAGPGGAAAGLALQGLLQDELAEATQVQYSITGSWNEPQFEPVEVERAGG
jgi:uncharacterized protein (TIGR02099 family)